MKERPIHFKPPHADEMVRAILDGRKTQERRVVKPSAKGCTVGAYVGAGETPEPVNVQPDGDPWTDITCPYGQPGDRLWVREAFALLGNEDGVCIDWDGNLQKGDEREAARIYRASCERAEYGLWRIPDKADWKPKTDAHHFDGPWRPSIHMPRWASRITLEIVSAHVERLQEISEEDAWNEGIQDWMGKETPWKGQLAPVSVHAFAAHWESINGADSWNANPWIWVVEFRRLDHAGITAGRAPRHE